MSNDRSGRRLNSAPLRRGALYAAVAAALGAPLAAHAFEIPTGNDDLVLRWDNTVRYNLGMRTQSQDQAILKNWNFDDGDRNFSNGSLVTNRFDVLTEMDIVWKRQFGARVSAAGWYDFAYRSLDNTNTASANTLNSSGLPVAGELSPYTSRYAKGVSGEWLDAFVFANFDVGDIPLSIKAGQHTVFWGDSLLLGGAIHGISYAQNSLDIWKGLSTPGAEAKELFRPKGGITLQAQVTNELSLAGQWFYNWQALRVPESGSYLTITDPYLFGGSSVIVGPSPFTALGSPALLRAWNAYNVPDSRNSGNLGDWGVSARWNPVWLDGTMGFYYRNATDIAPQLLLTPGFAPVPSPAVCVGIGGTPLATTSPTPCIINKNVTNPADLTTKGKFGTYQAMYGNNIHFYGLTLAKNIGGVSLGMELSYRENMPLLSDAVTALPAPLVNPALGQVALAAVPADGDTVGAVGNTFHGILNAVGIFGKTELWDTASWQAEFTWMRWDKVTQNMGVFKGRPGYTAIDGVTKDFLGLGVNFTPTWFQVYPGMDLLAPMSFSIGLSGNSAVALGGQEGAGNYALGLALDMYQKYRVDLKYTGYLGNYTTTATGGATAGGLPAGAVFGTSIFNGFNGTNAALSDRGWVSLTFKTTF